MAEQTSHGTSRSYRAGCRCDVCKSYKRAVDAAHYARHRDEVKARTRAYYQANTEKALAAQRARYWNTLEERRAEARAYSAANSERIVQRVYEWRKTEKGRAARHAESHARRGVPFTKAAKDYIRVIKSDPCVYCGGLAGEIDHIVPLASGGTGDWDNVASACRSCNAKKHTTDLLSFLLRSNSHG